VALFLLALRKLKTSVEEPIFLLCGIFSVDFELIQMRLSSMSGQAAFPIVQRFLTSKKKLRNYFLQYKNKVICNKMSL